MRRSDRASWRFGSSGRPLAWALGLAVALGLAAPLGQSAKTMLSQGTTVDPGSQRQPESSDSHSPYQSGLQSSLVPSSIGPCRRLNRLSLAAGEDAGLGSLDTLVASPTGAWLLEQARRLNVSVCLDAGTNLNGYYRSQRRLIGLNSHQTTARRIGFLAHELGHVLQHPVFSNNRYLAPRDSILLRRLREAAAEAIATRLLWQLRQAGNSAPWNAKQRTGYRDILTAFEKAHRAARTASFSAGSEARNTLNSAELAGTRAAFKQWFNAKWRRNTYDAMTLAHLETIAGDRLGLVPPRFVLTEAFLRPLGYHQGGTFLLPGDRLRQPAYSRRLAPTTVARLEALEALIMAGRGLALPRR